MLILDISYNQQAWLLKLCAIELRVASLRQQKSYLTTLVSNLIGTTATQPSMLTSNISMLTQRIASNPGKPSTHYDVLQIQTPFYFWCFIIELINFKLEFRNLKFIGNKNTGSAHKFFYILLVLNIIKQR